LILARAVPEYIWAFLFIAILGQGAWPAILALALHNTGILGRLGAEVVENVERRPPSALRGLGAGRLQIHLFGILPVVLPRFLVFFFYRWETCVREATVLGMLGVLSLGYLIRDARARDHYDDMLVFILLGAILVLAVDALSAILRNLPPQGRLTHIHSGRRPASPVGWRPATRFPQKTKPLAPNALPSEPSPPPSTLSCLQCSSDPP
jgi:phosphonate transport system permease protein